jgi:putative transposase
VGLSRSSYYYQAKEPNDQVLREALIELAPQRRRFGYRRLGILLHREGFKDNHKRIFRVYQEEGLQVRKRKRKRAAKWRGNNLSQPTKINERWSLDFIHDALENGRRLRVLNVIDDFSRECLASEVDTSLSGQRVIRVLDRLLELRGSPQSLVLDNGPEFTGKALDAWAYKNHVLLNFIEPGKPVQNAYVESFHGKLRDECLNENWFINLTHAQQIIENWRNDYNQYRPHSSLNNMTPKEYMESLAEATIPPWGDGDGALAPPNNEPGLSL